MISFWIKHLTPEIFKFSQGLKIFLILYQSWFIKYGDPVLRKRSRCDFRWVNRNRDAFRLVKLVVNFLTNCSRCKFTKQMLFQQLVFIFKSIDFIKHFLLQINFLLLKWVKSEPSKFFCVSCFLNLCLDDV
jgi:hypothetical protein